MVVVAEAEVGVGVGVSVGVPIGAIVRMRVRLTRVVLRGGCGRQFGGCGRAAERSTGGGIVGKGWLAQGGGRKHGSSECSERM